MKKMKIPSTFTIVFSIIIACAILTWIIQGGEFARKVITVDGTDRSVVIPDSYQQVENVPQTWQIFTAFFKGFERTAHIIVFILMIGGAFWILNYTKAIDIGIISFLKGTQKLKKNKFFNLFGVNNIIITLIMIVFSLFGSVFGMSEETIAFIIIFVPLSVSMGYDSVVGVLMCYVAAHIGFAGAMLNPFTIGIAQGLSGLPTFSGIEYRFICWIILTIVVIIFTLWYASRVKKNPKRSFMYEADSFWRDKASSAESDSENNKATVKTWIVYALISAVLIFCSIKMPFTNISIGGNVFTALVFPVVTAIFIILGFFAIRKSVHNLILTILLLTVIILVVGVLGYHWYVKEIAALFFAMGLAAGFAYNLKFDHCFKLFLEGTKDIMVAALVVGMAGGIIIILEDGKIIDTILYSISQSMTHGDQKEAIGVMYVIQGLINILIPSGSAKAALTIPMMAEFSDIVGLSRQLTVLTFQFGEGFTNMITPTSGVLIGVLGAARIPFAQWVKFIWPFILIMTVIGFFLLLPPLYFSFNGF